MITMLLKLRLRYANLIAVPSAAYHIRDTDAATTI